MIALASIVPQREEAARLLECRDYPGAIAVLAPLVGADPTGECHAMLGLAHFQLQDYESAISGYRAALARDPGNADWQEMLARASANAVAQIGVHVPEIRYFDRASLLAPPRIEGGILPAAPRPRMVIRGGAPAPKTWRRRGLGRNTLHGNRHGAVGTVAGFKDEIWTNWYRRRLTLAILTLAYMRERLNRGNLKNTYPAATLTGFQAPGREPPEGVIHFRTADGSWNNLANPMEGAAGTRFLRNVEVDAIRPETGARLMTPNPREISRKLLTRRGAMMEIPFLNLLAAAWIQFENHDWINHGEILFNDVHEIPLANDDPARRQYHQARMLVGKTQPDPTRSAAERIPISFINEVTHWWDGSQIYGSDQSTQNRLRSFVHGKLRLNPDGTLPLDSKGIEQTGFQRNWWVGLALLHTAFAREHNAICDRLRTSYPQWDDRRLFNVARLVNAAVMAKIHTVEWTPAVLPNPALNAALNANWFGLLTNLFAGGKNRRTLSDINISNPELGGVVGNPINKHGEPFGLTEEFVEVYRLHSFLPETLQLKKLSPKSDFEEIPFPASRQAGSAKITARFGIAEILHSFGLQLPGQLTLNNYPKFMQELSIPGNPLFDLGAVDILRARERGVPRYNEFRRQLGLNPIRRFTDLTDNSEHVKALEGIYGHRAEDVESLDLMIGTLAEGHRPAGFGFGETLFQIFILNATRRLQADRFYTDNYDETTYTKEGLDWIDDANLKKVLLRHYPELAETGLANIANAFEPWDTGQRLDPTRHPLRAFDLELDPDPWLGDRFR